MSEWPKGCVAESPGGNKKYVQEKEFEEGKCRISPTEGCFEKVQVDFL